MKHFYRHIKDLIKDYEDKFYVKGLKYEDFNDLFNSKNIYKRQLNNIADRYDNIINDIDYEKYVEHIENPETKISIIEKYIKDGEKEMDYYVKRNMY